MNKPKKVTGQSCLSYINKPIGFYSSCPNGLGWGGFTCRLGGSFYNNFLRSDGESAYLGIYPDGERGVLSYNRRISIEKYNHDVNKRIIGLILDDNDDGSYKIALLSDDKISWTSQSSNIEYSENYFNIGTVGDYYPNEDDKYDFPSILQFTSSSGNYAFGKAERFDGDSHQYTVNVDELSDYKFRFYSVQNNLKRGIILNTGEYKGDNVYENNVSNNNFQLSTNKNNTLIIGKSTNQIATECGLTNDDNVLMFNTYNNSYENWEGDLISELSDIYQWLMSTSTDKPPIISEGNRWNYFTRPAYDKYDNVGFVGTSDKPKFAYNFLPYNLVLTRNENDAIEYIQNGVLPSDAFLYPLDWDNLPQWKPSDSGDDDDDGDPGGTNPDGNRDRDVDQTPLEPPAILPTMLNVNNIYWIGVGRLGMFFTWFWYDIQQFSILDPTTWDNLVDNIQGLYSDLASAVLSIRYFPVKPEWLGGLGNQSRIKLAQIEQDGLVDTITTFRRPPIEKIGSYNVSKDFDSFLDLPPYSQLVLYLPYYGYVDLDIDIFNGHSLDVYATYDVLSGTITYYIYYDDTFMVNTYMAKMSVDVPITLQSQYDRDRTIQSNVMTALSGFMSAGAGTLSGNPIGMVMGINSLDSTVSPQNTAPIKVEGMLAEQGMFYAPSKCAVILRRPTTTKKGDGFKHNIGYLWCKTETLNNLTGLTICSHPRIHFNGTEYYNEQDQPTGKMILPLESEIEEIYDYLEKGVII